MIRAARFPEALAVEAVLHVIDGARLIDVAYRYGMAFSTLSLIVRGYRRPEIRNKATRIYDAYRATQCERLGYPERVK